MSDYITIAGIVQFDPRTRTAGDKQVRDVLIVTGKQIGRAHV